MSLQVPLTIMDLHMDSKECCKHTQPFRPAQNKEVSETSHPSAPSSAAQPCNEAAAAEAQAYTANNAPCQNQNDSKDPSQSKVPDMENTMGAQAPASNVLSAISSTRDAASCLHVPASHPTLVGEYVIHDFVSEAEEAALMELLDTQAPAWKDSNFNGRHRYNTACTVRPDLAFDTLFQKYSLPHSRRITLVVSMTPQHLLHVHCISIC